MRLAVQQRAMRCLVNWARARAGLRRLEWSRALAEAATTKAKTIASCDDFSHHPCGVRFPAVASRSCGFDVWGENL